MLAALEPRLTCLNVGELVGKMGGEVLVIPAARMPTRTGVAAIYRY